MMWKHLKAMLAAVVLATGVVGFALGQWAAADPASGPRKPLFGSAPPVAKDAPPKDAPQPAEKPAPAVAPPKADDAKPPAAGRRREAVIRIPAGTFVKDVDVQPYGRARITWTYEDDRVLGLIEAAVMGFEIELGTEAEFSLSSNGTIYGIVTAVKLNHVRIPDGEGYAELKPFLGLWPLVEPLLNEMLTDLPFSYQFRLSGNRLTILNYRALLAGPNPLGKAGAMAIGEAGILLGGFQALGTAIEGTYTTADAREPEAPKRPAPIRGSGTRPAGLGFGRVFRGGTLQPPALNFTAGAPCPAAPDGPYPVATSLPPPLPGAPAPAAPPAAGGAPAVAPIPTLPE